MEPLAKRLRERHRTLRFFARPGIRELPSFFFAFHSFITKSASAFTEMGQRIEEIASAELAAMGSSLRPVSQRVGSLAPFSNVEAASMSAAEKPETEPFRARTIRPR